MVSKTEDNVIMFYLNGSSGNRGVRPTLVRKSLAGGACQAAKLSSFRDGPYAGCTGSAK